MLYVYIGCLSFGLIYSIVAAVAGGHGFGHGDMDHGMHHSGGNDADAPSFFNPLVIASAITTFGAAGLIGKMGFEMGDMLSSVLAVAFSGLVGTAVFFGVVKLMYESQSNSTFSWEDLIETDAEISIPIPKNGFGEISYTMNGVRNSMPAKAICGDEFARGSVVVIKEINGNIAFIDRKKTLEDIESIGFLEDKEGKKLNNKT